MYRQLLEHHRVVGFAGSLAVLTDAVVKSL